MSTALARQANAADIIEEYEAKVAAIPDAIRALKEAENAINYAATVRGCYIERIASVVVPHEKTMERNLLSSAWKVAYERLNIDKVATAKDKELFKRTLAAPPPFTVENLKASFGDYLVNPRFHILRGLAEAFCALDPAYKSHSKVRIGVKGLPKRLILNNWGGFYSTWGRDRFRDIANALAAYQGKPQIDHAEMVDIDEQHKHDDDAYLNGRELKRYVVGGDDEPFTTPDRGMWVRRYKNGNAHVYFDAPTLLDINRALAEFYGEVLPDAEPENVKPSASTAVSKDMQYYPTPKAVAEMACEFAGVHGSEAWSRNKPIYRVLEPSCGDGRIMEAIAARGHIAFGIEYHPGRAAEARAKGLSVLTANFLDQPATPDFDHVVMNPPFYGRHYVKHVRHALKFLKPGGTLVAILPATARYDHGELDGEWQDLPVASFAESGTNVPTVMLKIINKENTR